MQNLALRLAAVDPEAGAAVEAVAHFDSLVGARAGLESIVRGAATLAGCPVRLVDPARRVVVRVLADGARAGWDADPEPTWPSVTVAGGTAVLWLERPGPPGTVGGVVLERAAAAAAAVIQRTRSRRPVEDPASLEVVLDAAAPLDDRLAAARRLALASSSRVVALHGEVLVIAAGRPVPEGRAGVGPCVGIADLPSSAALARLALRLTAEGTEADPGPRVVHADDLGALPMLLRAADAARSPVPDVQALERAAAAAPWVLATLEAVAASSSLRDAARSRHVHHSTLQDRLRHAEALIGWDVREPPGRLRLDLALALRRAARSTA